MEAFSPRDAAELYNIQEWGRGYFDINEAGHVVLTTGAGETLDLKNVVDDLVRRGLSMPLLLRFSNILEKRIQELHQAFADKIEEYDYQGKYQPVMPIKVNQQRHVVEELLELGAAYDLGLEAGSKPELLVALAMAENDNALIICNGYKDESYIETALLSQKLGRTTLIIVDRFQELDMIIKASKRLGLRPKIGVRAKIMSKGSGRWAESAGARSKFGLSAGELVRVVEVLRKEDMLDTLVCLHFHIGSQITAIRAIKDALAEAVQIFTNLYQLGAPLSYLDVGGGLAVDYDGSKSNFHASKNYSLNEYAADIIYAIDSVLSERSIPHPTIISESGRALVAHHAVLVFNVLGKSEERKKISIAKQQVEEHQILADLREISQTINRKNYQEAYHDIVQLKEDALTLFRHGILSLQERAEAESLFWASSDKIQRIVSELDYVPEDLESIKKQLAEIYFCNFSIFQSLPDAWAVKHLFPVMPIHRLTKEPTRRAILADLTCDSDGKIDQFIDLHDVKDTLELHSFDPNEPYFLGIFLVGAYQETLGDLHNLFGDVNTVHIRTQENGQYQVTHVIEGDRVSDVLSYVSYEKRTLMAQIRVSIEAALSQGQMSFEESAALIRHFEAGLDGYTYLEDPDIGGKLLSSILPNSQKPPPESRTDAM